MQIKPILIVAAFTSLMAVMFEAGSAQAGGLEIPDLGTVALGRGTAFAAKADNLSAFHYNPAGLSKSKGINVLLSVNLLHLSLDYARYGSGGCWQGEVGGTFLPGCEADPASTCPPGEICVADPSLDHSEFPEDATAYKSVSSDKKLGALPMVVVNWGDIAGVEGLSVALGLLPPSSFGTPSYPHDGAQRYALREANHLIVYPGFGVAYEVNRYFRIGGVFLSGIGHFRQSQAIRSLPLPTDTLTFNERKMSDAHLALDARDNFIPSGIFGIMSQPLDWLELGVTVKLPAKIEAEGTVSYTPSERDLPNSRLVEGRDKVTLKQSFPWMVRAGVRYIHEIFDVEVDFVWEDWSSLRAFEVDMDAALFDGNYDNIELPDVEIPKNFKDTYSVRLGGDVEVWKDRLTLRIGGFYQSSAYPDNNETFSLDFPFAEQIGVGGGLTFRTCKYLDVNLGYMHIFQPDVEVKQGVLQQQGLPYEPDPVGQPGVTQDTGNVVNGGKYQVNINTFGVSLEGHFL